MLMPLINILHPYRAKPRVSSEGWRSRSIALNQKQDWHRGLHLFLTLHSVILSNSESLFLFFKKIYSFCSKPSKRFNKPVGNRERRSNRLILILLLVNEKTVDEWLQISLFALCLRFPGSGRRIKCELQPQSNDHTRYLFSRHCWK